MEISIFGLGYVGCVSAACLAQDGHTVIGVDINPQKLAQIRAAQSPIVEPGLQELIENGVASGRLQVSSDTHQAVARTRLSLICVGTPSKPNGDLELDYVKNVCREIGQALAAKADYHLVVIRSTVLPGSVQSVLIPILEQASGKRAGQDFGVCMNPEFLREGSAIKDYYRPSFIVIGQIDARSGDLLEPIYAAVQAPSFRTDLPGAETIKYACNAFHALKVAFANEIGNVCKAHGVDGQVVMDIFSQDTQLNISPVYLRPGFAFGGSCLPKDVRALTYRARSLDVETPVLNALLPSNTLQIQRAITMIERTGSRRVGILGLSFKHGTDDVRESPTVAVVEYLLGKGYQVQIYDRSVDLIRLVGANKSFLEQELPHISQLLRTDLAKVTAQSDVLVIANGSPEFSGLSASLRPGQTLIDLIGIAKSAPVAEGSSYDGICW